MFEAFFMPVYNKDEDSVILFDGYCNLCSSVVQFVIKRDKNDVFKFASLQSDFGIAVLKKFNLDESSLNSFVLIQKNQAFTRSTAALLVAKQLSGLYRFLYVFIVIPAFIRNFVYKFIAANRYRWFGKKGSCWLPPFNTKDKFLDMLEATYLA